MIVSFYSYKGGVGRTQLCANVAAYLYHRKGKKVLLWDWDFEAPGLHYFFGKTNKDISSGGTLELLESYMKTMRTDPEVVPDKLPYFTSDNVISLSSEVGKPGCVDLLPAGNYNDEFSFRSSNFDWFEFYSMNDGARYFELVKDNLELLGYDYIFIDSRTGISDYSGICNVQLPEINIMVIAATMQNFEGCRSIITRIQESEYRKINKIEAKILPILSRIDKSGPEYGVWISRFSEYFAKLIGTLDPDMDPMFLDDIFSDIYFAETCLHYTSAISAGENVFASEEKLSKTDFGRPFLQIAEHIESIANNGKIDFYKKIDEATWEEYGDFARNEKDNNKAAYAYTQAGMLQSEPSKKSMYFEEALNLVKDFPVAKDNLDKLGFEKTVFLSTNEQILIEKDQKKGNRLYIYVIISLVMISLLISFALLFFKRKDITTIGDDGPLAVRTPVIPQDDPLKASAYFESIRKSGKALGIDISAKDQILDQSKLVRYGISFALIKATVGGSFKDGSFDVNWAVSKNAKFKTGAYHFFLPNKTGLEQSNNFIKNVKLTVGDLPPILSLSGLESNVGADAKILIDINTFLDAVSVNYGVKPIIFTSKLTAEKYFTGDTARYSLWIGDANQAKEQPALPGAWKNWSMWQFSTKEHFDGLISGGDKTNKGLADGNVFNGTVKELEAFCINYSRGRTAVVNASALLMKREQLYKVAGERVIINKDTLNIKAFKKYNFNWSVELINHCFSTLNKKTLYGRNSSKLYRMLNYNKLLMGRLSTPKIGDVAFFDFMENKGIQTCGIIYSSDRDSIYLIEGSSPDGLLNVRLTKRLKADVYSYARLK